MESNIWLMKWQNTGERCRSESFLTCSFHSLEYYVKITKYKMVEKSDTEKQQNSYKNLIR
jgi:hypothetical protein